MTSLTKFVRSFVALRSVFLIFIAFLIPIGLLLNGSLESRCAYVMVSMAILWFTEALPIAVTAMVPMFLLPLLAVQPGKVVCGNYFNDTSALFLAGLMMGVAMYEVHLHKRIAIGITMLLGASPNSIMLGLMISSWFLSLWISNTAAASMMLPILIAVIEQTTALDDNSEAEPRTNKQHGNTGVKDSHLREVANESSKVEPPCQSKDMKSEPHHESKRLNKGLTLRVAYATNIGGIATLNGSVANLVFQVQADKRFQEYGAVDSGITYANWMGFAFPLSLIMLFLTWFWLQIVFIRCGFGEIIVLILFVTLALLLLVRDLPGVGGWGDFFLDANGTSAVTDSTAAILLGTLLFILPKRLPNISALNTSPEWKAYTPILTWKVAEKKVAWGVLVLYGGGFALADACTTSGLSRLVGCELRVLKGLEPWVMNLVLCLIVAAVTEINSNATTSTLLMPIMFELSITVGVHPLYFMISACIACSFAFMLPVATPPNAIVFSTGTIRIPDMALTGFLLNILAVGMLTLAINTWGTAILKGASRGSLQ